MTDSELSARQLGKLCELDAHARKLGRGGIASEVQRDIRGHEERLKRLRPVERQATYQPTREQVIYWACNHRIFGDMRVTVDDNHYPQFPPPGSYHWEEGSILALIDRRGLSMVRRWFQIGLAEFPVWGGDRLLKFALEEKERVPKVYWIAAHPITPHFRQGTTTAVFSAGMRGPTIEEALSLASVLGFWTPEKDRQGLSIASYLSSSPIPFTCSKWECDGYGVPRLQLHVGVLGELKDVRHYQVQIIAEADSGASCG